jgi:two-component system NtrC family sensor kinase
MQDESSSDKSAPPSIEGASAFFFRELALGVFHQLGNDLLGLGSSLLLIQALVEAIPPAIAQKGQLTGLVAQSLKQIGQAKDMLHTVRSRGSRLEPMGREYFFSTDVVRPAVEHQTKIAERYGVSLRYSFGSQDFVVRVDRELMREAVTAMLNNAIWAVRENRTGRRPEVSVTVRAARDSFVRTEITDTGAGIAPGLVTKIFDPFFTTREQGTGLGLYFARLVVEHFGGAIRLERTALRKGSTFSVMLPYIGSVGYDGQLPI